MSAERYERARGYAGYVCTLDGHRATITGRLNAFATVASTDGSLLRAEFAWPTVGRIMAAGGAFRLTERATPRSLATSIERVESSRPRSGSRRRSRRISRP